MAPFIAVGVAGLVGVLAAAEHGDAAATDAAQQRSAPAWPPTPSAGNAGRSA